MEETTERTQTAYGKFFHIPTELIKRSGNDTATSLSSYSSINDRSNFMRDRDRVLYCTAFRRLAGKTQIYTTGSDDHKRNRLTHTLEVAQIAKSIARGLGLDEDLSEAIALGHDLGHTPFGHAGEEFLHKAMVPHAEKAPLKGTVLGVGEKNQPLQDTLENSWERYYSSVKRSPPYSKKALFGFKHNLQSVRVASSLEDSYRDPEGNNLGLNLTNYTLWGMQSHSKSDYGEKLGSSYINPNYQHQYEKLLQVNGIEQPAWSFEAYVVELADDIAQWHHDLEDAVRGNALSQKSIRETINEALLPIDGASKEKNEANQKARQALEDAETNPVNRSFLAILAHIVVNELVTDLVETSRANLETLYNAMVSKGYSDCKELYSDYSSVIKQCELEGELEDRFENPQKIIAFSESVRPNLIKSEIRDVVLHSRDVERMDSKGQFIIKNLFEAYYTNPQQLTDGAIYQILIDFGFSPTEDTEKYKNTTKAMNVPIGRARADFQSLLDLREKADKKGHEEDQALVLNLIIMRRICDHIASMTDRYALEEYENLYG